MGEGFLITLILLAYTSRYNLSGNEEHYMLMSKFPGWDFTANRYLYQRITGFALNFFSFELTAIIGRLILCISIAVPITLFAGLISLENVSFLMFFFLSGQALFGGETLIESWEPKTIAYILGLIGLYYGITGGSPLVWLIIATYFHVIAGGYLALITYSYLLLEGDWFYPEIYLLCVSPLLLYIVMGSKFDVYANIIYSNIRNSHHAGIFSNKTQFVRLQLLGVVNTLASVIIVYYTSVPELEKFRTLILMMGIWSLAWVGIAYLDTKGKLVKYLPFRVNTIFLLFLSMYLGKLVEDLPSWLFFALGLVFCLIILQHLVNDLKLTDENNSFSKMCEVIKLHTKPEDEILYLGNNLSLSRRTGRKEFFNWKFIPSTSESIKKWNRRYLIKNSIEENLSNLQRTSIKYVLLERESEWKWLKLIHSEGKFHLYKNKAIEV